MRCFNAAWNYYPPITPEQEADIKKGQLPPRLHAHADMDVLTLLYQREGTACLFLELNLKFCSATLKGERMHALYAMALIIGSPYNSRDGCPRASNLQSCLLQHSQLSASAGPH